MPILKQGERHGSNTAKEEGRDLKGPDKAGETAGQGKEERGLGTELVKEIGKRLYIDERKLDEERRKQPSWLFYYSVKMADAKLSYLQTKHFLDVTKALVAKRIREGKGEKDKLTEKMVEEMVTIDNDIMTLTKSLLEKQYFVDIYKAATIAFAQRGKVLTMSETTHGQNINADILMEDEDE